VHATAATDTRDDVGQAAQSQLETVAARLAPLLGRLAEHVAALDPVALATRSSVAHDHVGPLLRLAERARHQMSEPEEHLLAELSTTGSSAWARLVRTVTSQLTAEVTLPGRDRERLPMTAVRGLATHDDPAVRRLGLAAENEAWPQVAPMCAAAMNAVKGEAAIVNRRRRWASPLDASLFANSVSRETFDAMQRAIDAALPRLRSWMRTKARVHGHTGGLPWYDLMAPLPGGAGGVSWDDGVQIVRDAFRDYSLPLAGLVDRALTERWIDVAPRDGKIGGASCRAFTGDRSLVLLNWSGSLDSVQVTAHELGHAYHNTQLAHRSALQRRLPMALAETASIFCETLVVESGLQRLHGHDLLALLDLDLQGTLQVVVDIRSRLLFELEVFERRSRRTLGITELDELMLESQQTAYGDGLDHSTANRHMWVLKPHYYNSHLYNWPYTYGLLFGLGLFAEYCDDPERFRNGYDDLLSRAGMNTAEELGRSFGLDVTDDGFWAASLRVVTDRIDGYERLVRDLGLGGLAS
jgi:pepF/M3 family oligoendopeptidase